MNQSAEVCVYTMMKTFLFNPKNILGASIVHFVRHLKGPMAKMDSRGAPKEEEFRESGEAVFAVADTPEFKKTADMKVEKIRCRYFIKAAEAVVDLYLTFGMVVQIPVRLQDTMPNLHRLVTTPKEDYQTFEWHQKFPGLDETKPWSNVPILTTIVVWLASFGSRVSYRASGCHRFDKNATQVLCFSQSMRHSMGNKGDLIIRDLDVKDWSAFGPRFHFMSKVNEKQELLRTAHSLTLTEVIRVLLYNIGPLGKKGYLTPEDRIEIDEQLNRFTPQDTDGVNSSGDAYSVRLLELNLLRQSDKDCQEYLSALNQKAEEEELAAARLASEEKAEHQISNPKSKSKPKPRMLGEISTPMMVLKEGSKSLIAAMKSTESSSQKKKVARVVFQGKLRKAMENCVEDLLKLAAVSEFNTRNLYLNMEETDSVIHSSKDQRMFGGTGDKMVKDCKILTKMLFKKNGRSGDYNRDGGQSKKPFSELFWGMEVPTSHTVKMGLVETKETRAAVEEDKSDGSASVVARLPKKTKRNQSTIKQAPVSNPAKSKGKNNTNDNEDDSDGSASRNHSSEKAKKRKAETQDNSPVDTSSEENESSQSSGESEENESDASGDGFKSPKSPKTPEVTDRNTSNTRNTRSSDKVKKTKEKKTNIRNLEKKKPENEVNKKRRARKKT